MSRIADSLNPSERDSAKESSRFGPIVVVDPAAASAWQPAHFSWNILRPFSLSEDALTTEPPVPHADNRSATATPPMAAESPRAKAYAGGLSADFTLETAS